jgi:hypothetical protein
MTKVYPIVEFPQVCLFVDDIPTSTSHFIFSSVSLVFQDAIIKQLIPSSSNPFTERT